MTHTHACSKLGWRYWVTFPLIAMPGLYLTQNMPMWTALVVGFVSLAVGIIWDQWPILRASGCRCTTKGPWEDP